jgi:hypothetical protein
MIPDITFAPLYFTLVFIKRVWLRLLPTLLVLSFASVNPFGKSPINSWMSAGLSRSFYRTPNDCLPISNSSSTMWLKSCRWNLSRTESRC